MTTLTLNDQTDPHAATPAEQQSILQVTESYHCPRCEGAIDNKCIERAGDHRDLLRLNIRIYCEHCDAAWGQTFAMCGGMLRAITGVAEITGAAISRFKRRIDHLRGDRQID
jgi:hypothetical protein